MKLTNNDLGSILLVVFIGLSIILGLVNQNIENLKTPKYKVLYEYDVHITKQAEAINGKIIETIIKSDTVAVDTIYQRIHH